MTTATKTAINHSVRNRNGNEEKTQPEIFYDYHVWAYQTIMKRLKELPRSVYRQEVTSVFPSIAKAMAHIYVTDYGWLDILSGRDMAEALASAAPLAEVAESKEIEELETMFNELAERYSAFFAQQADLEQKLVIDNPYARIRDTRLSEIILHVVNHGTYHRGNVTAMLNQLGHSSAMNDYALFWYQ